MSKTIAAISTPLGVGGISVIRISGDDAVLIADKVFRGKKPLSAAASHTLHYGYAVDENGQKIDEVLAAVMLSGRSFTGEDTVEISTHGGMLAPKNVMRALLFAGASPAEGGEFTKRAFLNGRIDLSQAEAVIDIINAKTDLASKNALSQAGGSLRDGIEKIRKALVELAAAIQVLIDYPDEDLNDLSTEEILSRTLDAKDAVSSLLETAGSGRVLSEGILTAIVGKPNVGKSSLLNCLSHEESAIVTEIAGTTRDIVKETVDLDGVPLRLLDTAGIRETQDAVEKIGVTRSLLAIEEADLIFLMLDAETSITDEDIKILEDTKDKNRIILINKTDLYEPDFELSKEDTVINVSAKTGKGTDEIAAILKKRYKLGDIGKNDSCVVTNLRHVSALSRAKDALCRMKNALLSNTPTDLVTIDLNMAIDSLGEITGACVSEDIVSEIFHNFCVGK